MCVDIAAAQTWVFVAAGAGTVRGDAPLAPDRARLAFKNEQRFALMGRCFGEGDGIPELLEF